MFIFRKEIQAIQKKNIIYGALTAIRNSYPATACFLSIAALWGAGINLTPTTVFTISLMFKNLAGSTVEAIIEGAYSFSICKVTLSRMKSFLINEGPHSNLIGESFSGEKPYVGEFEQPRPTSMTNIDTLDKKLKGPCIQMINVSSHVKTKKESNLFSFRLLNGISLQCNERDLTAITGYAGSGKSSVLKVIAGEVPVTNGKIFVSGRIAYMPQSPWLFSGTIQENIVFGNDFNEEKYHATIEACALIDDFKQFPLGDMTHVGESGVALSGGQRARVSLARTVYSDADIFLLDNPLKALDARVGELIYEKCICGLLSTHPRIHVTHDKKYLRNASVIYTMINGCIVSSEKPQHKEDEKEEKSNVNEPLKWGAEQEVEANQYEVDNDVPLSGKKGLSVQDEDQETGSISTKTYMNYFRTATSVSGVILCILLVSLPAGENLINPLICSQSQRTVLIRARVNNFVKVYTPEWCKRRGGLMVSGLGCTVCLSKTLYFQSASFHPVV